MQWHQVEINKSGDLVTWTIDGLLIATVDLNTVTLGGGNIFFGHSDINTGSSIDERTTTALHPHRQRRRHPGGRGVPLLA